MIGGASLATILGMALVTYGTRTIGFLLLRNRQLGKRARAVLEVAPGCVLVSAIAPYFVSRQPDEVLALLITALAAARLSMLATVASGVASLALLHYLFNSGL